MTLDEVISRKLFIVTTGTTMAKKGTPDWVDNFNEDVVAKDYWHYGGLHGVRTTRTKCYKNQWQESSRNLDYILS